MGCERTTATHRRMKATEMSGIQVRRSGGVTYQAAKNALLAELHTWERKLVLQSLSEAVRLIESEKVAKLTAQHLHAIAEYGSIWIDEEVFFDKAFSSGKEVAACLAVAMEIGWQEARDDIVRLRRTVTGPDARVVTPGDER
jgi:hypothetical protein